MDLSIVLIIMAGVAAAITALWAHEGGRQAEFRELAERRGFTYIGHALPRSVSLRGTGLEDATAVANTIDGECRGTRVVVFDCQLSAGESSRDLTAIAIQGPAHLLGDSHPGDLIVESCGEWSFLYEREISSAFQSSVMSGSEVEAHLNWILR